MIVVHHLEKSRSQRVLWLLEELGLPYEVQRYARDPVTSLAPPSLMAVHPLGKSPVVVDGGQVLAESGAIIESLVARFDADGRLAPPPGTPERLRYTYWMHYAEGTLMPLLVLSLILKRIERAPLLVRPVAKAISARVGKGYLWPNLRLNQEHVERALADGSWFAGSHFSAADIQMSFPIEALVSRGKGGLPNCRDFLDRIHARPAYQRALETGGPFELLD